MIRARHLLLGLLLEACLLVNGMYAFTVVSPARRPRVRRLLQETPSTSLFGPPSTTSRETISSSSLTSATSSSANDEFSLPPRKETSVTRMRRRKVKILYKKKAYNVGYLFALWYILSIAYNVLSKRVLNMAPELAWTAAWFQMACGLLYVCPQWMGGLRAKPELSKDDIARLLPVSILHSLVHVGGVVSMGAGAMSFTYIVKASEPAVSAALSAVTLKSFLPLPVYLTLIPVMGGVALSSVSELDFSWKSFNYAMLSNVASASRGIVAKKTISKRLGRNMNAMNLYAVLTLFSSVLLLPVTILLEGSVFPKTVGNLFATGKGVSYFAQLFLSAIFYYTYNEVSFLCLDNVSPVTHAIGKCDCLVWELGTLSEDGVPLTQITTRLFFAICQETR